MLKCYIENKRIEGGGLWQVKEGEEYRIGGRTFKYNFEKDMFYDAAQKFNPMVPPWVCVCMLCACILAHVTNAFGAYMHMVISHGSHMCLCSLSDKGALLARCSLVTTWMACLSTHGDFSPTSSQVGSQLSSDGERPGP